MDIRTKEMIEYLENIISIEKNLYQLKDIDKYFDNFRWLTYNTHKRALFLYHKHF